MTQKKQIQQTTKSSLQPSTARNAEIINDYLKLRDRLRTVHSGQTVVCTIGSWDILHEGHVAYLKDAHELGDVLVVGVDSDEAYERYKRDTVFYPEDDRQAIVAALRYVDYVTLISDVDVHGEWGMELVRAIDPDVFVCNNKSYSLEQRKRLESLCSGVVTYIALQLNSPIFSTARENLGEPYLIPYSISTRQKTGVTKNWGLEK